MPPLILNQLGPEIGGAVAAHALRPPVLHAARDGAPWESGEAEILLTGPSRSWSGAPTPPPPGWPGRLRWVQVASTGVDWFPRWLLDGPTVTCGRGHAAVPVAEYVLTAMLLHEKRLDRIVVRDPDGWQRHALGTLEGRTLGLAGYGAIGQAVAARAVAFGMHVLVLRRRGWSGADPHPATVQPVADLATLAARSDHLVLALPLTDATRGCVDAPLLAQAKPGLHLVNVARGGLVDQPALLAALDRGQLGFASLDVTEPEPLPARHPLYTHPLVRLTPHLSWAGGSVQQALARQILANLDRYLSRERLHDVVDPEHRY